MINNISFEFFTMIQEAIEQLRNVSAGLSSGRTLDSIETLNSRARELEKKVYKTQNIIQYV